MAGQPGPFVNFQSDAVPEAVRKRFAVPSLPNRVAGQRVDFPARHARPRMAQRMGLRSKHQVVRLGNERVRLPYRHRARHVRSVPVQKAPEIKQQHIPGTDGPVGRLRMRKRAAGARRHDRVESHALCAAPKVFPCDSGGNFLFGAAWTDPFLQKIEHFAC